MADPTLYSLQQGEILAIEEDHLISSVLVSDGSVGALGPVSETRYALTGLKPGETDLTVSFVRSGIPARTAVIKVYSNELPSDRVLASLKTQIESLIGGTDYLRNFKIVPLREPGYLLLQGTITFTKGATVRRWLTGQTIPPSRVISSWTIDYGASAPDPGDPPPECVSVPDPGDHLPGSDWEWCRIRGDVATILRDPTRPDEERLLSFKKTASGNLATLVVVHKDTAPAAAVDSLKDYLAAIQIDGGDLAFVLQKDPAPSPVPLGAKSSKPDTEIP